MSKRVVLRGVSVTPRRGVVIVIGRTPTGRTPIGRTPIGRTPRG